MARLLIAVTGTPGAGKSRLARALSAAVPGSIVVEANDVVDSEGLWHGTDASGARLADMRALELALKSIARRSKHSVIMAGHLLADLDIRPDITIVVRARLSDLIKRLEARGYSREKIRENLVSEIVDYCGANSRGREILEVGSARDIGRVVRYVAALSRSAHAKRPAPREISRAAELKRLLKRGNRYGL